MEEDDDIKGMASGIITLFLGILAIVSKLLHIESSILNFIFVIIGSSLGAYGVRKKSICAKIGLILICISFLIAFFVNQRELDVIRNNLIK